MKSRRPCFFAGALLVSSFLCSLANSQEVAFSPNASEAALGTGTSFLAADRLGNQVRLESDVPLRLSMVVAPDLATYAIQENPTPAAVSANFVLSGLRKDTWYMVRQDGVLIGKMKSSSKGTLEILQDISGPHFVVITDRSSTIYIRADGSIDPSTAPITAIGNVYFLSGDLAEPVIIQKDGIVLEGNGHLIQGAGQPAGIEASNRRSVTIRNVRVQGFQMGLVMTAINSVVSGSTFTANSDIGALIQLSGAPNTCNPMLPEVPPETSGDRFFNQSCYLISGNVFSGNGRIQLALGGNYFDQIKSNIIGPMSGSSVAQGVLISSVRRTLFAGNQVQRNGIGLLLQTSSRNAFTGNIILGHSKGLFLEDGTSANVISSNTFRSNSAAIQAFRTPGETIKNNFFDSNRDGIQLDSVIASPGAMLLTSNRFFTVGGGAGIALNRSRNITIKGNSFESGITAVGTSLSVNCIISTNSFRQYSSAISIEGPGQTNFEISSNTIESSFTGIQLFSADGNRIFHNEIKNNFDYGLRMVTSSSNRIYQNNFQSNGIAHARLESIGANTWNLAYPEGGNHWDDSTSPDQFSGPSQNKRFADGIVDVARVLATANQDNYAFVAPDGWRFLDKATPGAVTNLTAGTAQEASITLQWTAPGDDGYSGTAREYDFRFSRSPITSFNFDSQLRLSNAPPPLPAGSTQDMVVGGLLPATTYYFAVKAIDEVENKGPLSNVEKGVTNPDSTPPQPVTDLAVQYGSVRQTVPSVVIEPFNSDVLLVWSTPFDSSLVTAFRVFRSTAMGQKGFQISTVNPAGLSSAVKAKLGGKNFFVDAGSGLTNAATFFYTVEPVDLVGNVQLSGNNTGSILADKTPPILEVGLSPSATSFAFLPNLSRLTTRRLPPSREASFNLVRFQDEGLSGGFYKVALQGNQEIFITSGAFTDSAVSFSSPAFAANSTTSGLRAGSSADGCLTYLVIDRAGNRATSNFLPTNCFLWDGTPPFFNLFSITPEPVAAGPVLLELDLFEPLASPPEVSIRQAGSTGTVTVVFSSATTFDPLIFRGSFNVLPGFDGSARARVRAVDRVGNVEFDESQYFYIDTGAPLFDVRSSPGFPESFNPNVTRANIIADILNTPIDVVLELFNPDETAVVRSATFTNVSNPAVAFTWNGRDAMGALVADGTYVFRFRAFAAGGGFSNELGVPQKGFIRLVSSVRLGTRTRFPGPVNNSFPSTNISAVPVLSTAAMAGAISDGATLLSPIYDIQPSGTAFDPVLNLTICVPPGAPALDPNAVPPPQIKRFDPVLGWVSAGVPQTFSLGNTCLSVGLERLSLYAILGAAPKKDRASPETSLVISGRQFTDTAGSLYTSTSSFFSFLAVDPPEKTGQPSGVEFTEFRVDSDKGPFQRFISSFTLAESIHRLDFRSQDHAQNLEGLRSATILVDAMAPVSSATIGSPAFAAADGAVYVATTTPVAFSAADPALAGSTVPGSGVARVEVALDGGSFLAYSSAVFLAEGRHVFLNRAVDNVGNVSAVQSLAVRSDGAPPVSSLVIGVPQFQLPNALLVSSRTPFKVAAVDPISNDVASGVKDASFRVSDLAPGAAAFKVYAGSFAMAGADAGKVIEFFSRDNVLNAEVVRSSAVLFDSTPPEIALLSPASCGAGICRVLEGKIPVVGTARDPHFANYQLEFAPGQDATTGYALISSGTLGMSSGTLGNWDATALSGWLTLRLIAADLVANAAAVSINVFVGDPGELMMLGNHEVFDMPEGVAVGGDGKIYVADRNNDRIAVFSSTGALLASLGSRKDDDDDDDHKESTTTLRLNKPSGVAADAAGNVYVADTNRDRVLKLSADGQVLLTLGRREREKKHVRARLPGQFQHPAGVAVDAASNIYVADTGNRRVQVFSSTGTFNFQFNLPPVPARLDHDDGEKNDDDDEELIHLGKPSGIAVDAAGHIYVADSKGGRALKFGAAGELLLTIPIPGDRTGRFGEPFGVAVSSGGDCLLVSDRKSSRILKFDFLGNSNLVFGSKGKIKDDDAPMPSVIVFKKPMGLALDVKGSLFVADRNKNRIQKLGLPTGQAPLVVPPPKPEDDHIARGVADTEDGGKIERRDRAAVDIPAGAVALDLKITVSTPTLGVVDDSNRRRAAEDATLKTASPPVEYGPEGTKFKGAVTLTLPYSPDLVALQKIDAKDLIVRYWNREKTKWEDLESVVDLKTRTVKAKTTHFSLYQVFSGTTSAAALQPQVADATFTFHDAYAFPNPARGVNTTTIRIQTGLADSVEVRVYDVSGRKMHSSTNFSLNPSLDDGNGKGEQYTYDHVWDVSGIGSGVYQYVITAKKAGHSDIHKTGRIGVVK